MKRWIMARIGVFADALAISLAVALIVKWVFRL